MIKQVQLILLLSVFGGLISCSSDSDDNTPDIEKSYLNVDKTSFTISSEGGTLYASLSSNTTVSILNSKTWCKAVYQANKTTENLSITVEKNTEGKERTAGVLLSIPGKTVELLITQKEEEKNDEEDNSERVSFKVASYNIRYAAAADETTGNGWDKRKWPVANLIISHDFDIVGTQEGNDAQLADLKTYLPEYDFVGHPYGGSNHKLHNCAIFYKKAKFSVLDQGVFWYSETPNVASIGWDATDRRICYWAKFKELSSNNEFYFFTSHFYWQYTSARKESGPLLVSKMREIAGTKPVISTGDLNSSPTTSQIYAILTLLKDAYQITETPPVGPVGTSFPGGVFQGEPGGRIDYVFVSDHFKVHNYSVLTDSYDNNTRYPSDHLPVTSQVSMAIK